MIELKPPMNGMVPSVGLDDEIRGKARECSDFYLKESRKEMVKSPTMWGERDPFYVGFLGELAARRHFGLPIEIKKYLDYGYDFDLGERKVEVKTSRLHRPLEQPVRDGFKVFVSQEEKLKGSDTILFVKLAPGLNRAHLLGWIWKDELGKFPVIKYDKMASPAYTIYFKYMHPPGDLNGKHGK